VKTRSFHFAVAFRKPVPVETAKDELSAGMKKATGKVAFLFTNL
jgi:hypothetical protein